MRFDGGNGWLNVRVNGRPVLIEGQPGSEILSLTPLAPIPLEGPK